MLRVIVLAVLALIFLTGCFSFFDGPSSKLADVAGIQNAVPRFEPYSKYGNKPYRVFGKTYVPLRTADDFSQRGIASWYGKKFHGNKTSNGETYDMYAMTAAHKTLPLPSYVSVTNVKNNKKIIVRVNDRGPFIDNRVIDLSYAAATKLDLVKPGTGPVLIKAVTPKGGSYTVLPNYKHYLSAGTFGNKNNAIRLRRSLRSAGFDDAHLKEKRVSGRTYYQVRIGPIKMTKNIDRMIREVGRNLSEEPVIVTD